MPIRRLWHVTRRAAQDWWEDNCLRLAASLAYETARSLALLVRLIVGRVTRRIGATAVCGERQAMRHLIGEVQPVPTGGVWAGRWARLQERLFALALVLAWACLLRVARVISAALAGAAAWFHGPEQALVSRLLALAVSRLVLTLGFALLFTYVPDAEIRWRDVWRGGLIPAALFTLGKTAIGYYLGQASVGSAYGAAGSLVVLLVWVYYSALIMFFGAEFTHAWATRQDAVSPQPHAVAGAAPQTKGEATAERAPRS
jgi:membrane protein